MFLVMSSPPVDPGATFDACVAAHRRMVAGTVHIDSTNKAPGKAFHNVYTLKFRKPGKMLLNVRTVVPDRTDRSYFIDGRSLIAVDSLTSEYLRRSGPVTGSMAQRAEQFLGTLDDSVRVEIDPDALKAFLNTLRKARGWVKTGDTLTLSQNGKSSVRLEFTPGHLLKVANISGHGSLLSWRFAYGPAPATFSLPVPRGSQQVAAFVQGDHQQVAYAGKDVERLWRATMAAYGQLSSAIIQVKSGSRTATLAFSGKRAAQREADFAWAYDGRNLAVSRSGHFYRGRVALADLPSKVGERIDPFLQYWALHRNPARNLADQKMEAKLEGSERVSGTLCDRLQFTRPGVKVTVLVRRSDHLFARVLSENFDAKGNLFSSLEQSFTYRRINSGVPLSAFALSPTKGQKVEKLP